MITIQIRRTYKKRVSENLLAETAEFVLKRQKVDGDATIVVTGLKEIRELNLQYRQVDAPTDVLSFPEEYRDPVTNRKYLGDIIICHQIASKHAADEGHTYEDELRLLVTHGLLHLLGFDHTTSEDRKVMWDIQRRLLIQMNVPDTIFTHLESSQ